MKKYTIGVFQTRQDAEEAINYLHTDLGISTEEISYVYRNTEGEVKQVDADDVSDTTVSEGAGKGATAGAVVGGLAGIAAAAGIIPVIGPFVAAGAFLTALGITGAVGATVAGVATGAAVGGLVGALASFGVDNDRAKDYEDKVKAGNILVTVHSEKDDEVESALLQYGAEDVDTYMVNI